MAEMQYREPIFIGPTKFIFRTNFAGDPAKDKYKSTTRRGNLIIPDEEQALEMADAGYNVKQTRPREGEEEGFEPTYFVPIIIGYGHPKKKPKVYLVKEDKRAKFEDPDAEPVYVRTELTEDNVGIIDDIYVLEVKATLNPRYSVERDSWTLYVSQLYVEQDEDNDPWADQYNWRDDQ